MQRFWVQSVAFHSKKSPLLLVGTHCQEIPASVFTEISTLIDRNVLSKYPAIELVRYSESKLLFFPVDNSLRKKNEVYLAPIRRNIESILLSLHEDVTFSSFDKKIFLGLLNGRFDKQL